MKAVVYDAARSFSITEMPEPTPVIGVCGSDTHAAAGHHPFVPLPYNPGHEVVGVVRELGRDAQRRGDRGPGHRGAHPALLDLQDVLQRVKSTSARTSGSSAASTTRAGWRTTSPSTKTCVHVIPYDLSDLQVVSYGAVSPPQCTLSSSAGGVEVQGRRHHRARHHRRGWGRRPPVTPERAPSS